MATLSPRVKIIKAEIERQNLSVPSIADALDVAHSSVYRMLNGDTDPQLSLVEAIETILKITYKRVKK